MNIAALIFSIMGIIAGGIWFIVSGVSSLFMGKEGNFVAYMQFFNVALTLLIGILGIIYSSKEHENKKVKIFIIISGVVLLSTGSIFCGAIFLIVGGLLLYRTKNLEKNYKKCPFCANSVKREALVCQYCGKDILATENIPSNVINSEVKENPSRN